MIDSKIANLRLQDILNVGNAKYAFSMRVCGKEYIVCVNYVNSRCMVSVQTVESDYVIRNRYIKRTTTLQELENFVRSRILDNGFGK